MSSNIHWGKSWQHSNSLEKYESMFCKTYLRKLEQMKSLTFTLYKAIKGEAISGKATVLNSIFSCLNLIDNCRNLAVLCMSCQLNFSSAWQLSELNVSAWTFSILFPASLSAWAFLITSYWALANTAAEFKGQSWQHPGTCHLSQ